MECELAGENSEKTCPSSTLTTTNPTSPDLGSNPGRRGGKPATNRLNYGTAYIHPYLRPKQRCATWRTAYKFAVDTCILEKYIESRYLFRKAKCIVALCT
jgi:hypothetical protein